MAEGSKGDEVRRQAATDVLKHFSVDKKGKSSGAQTMNLIGDEAVKRMLDGLKDVSELATGEDRHDLRRVSATASEGGDQ
jgi:hypothetical protein